jgi:hypothetical protein
LKVSYLTAGIRCFPFLRLLGRNKISFRPATLLRIFFILQSSFWSSLFAFIEKIRFTTKINNTKLCGDPVFIVGHWRTGSTFLHQLLSLDPQFTAPTLFQVAIPDSFLTSEKYYRPLFKHLVSKSRPMDQVKLGMDEPQEDEYAIYRLTDYSPIEGVVFPKSKDYFLLHADRYFPPAREQEKWNSQLLNFYKKITLKTNRQIVSKNPFHSYRIDSLAAQFPESRFIHICRHPDAVIPSTIHMWNIVQKQNCLNDNDFSPTAKAAAAVMESLENKVEDQLSRLSPGRIARVRFEDLEAEPEIVLEKIYHRFSWTVSAELRARLKTLYKELQNYQKNRFSLTESQKQEIRDELKNYMKNNRYA